jgi:hypothetical protein
MAAVRQLDERLQRINEQARPYPAHLLPEGGTALCLFSAAFLGHNDAIHMARKGMLTTCIDTNGPMLREMERLYPPSWTFLNADAWDFALEAVHHSDVWDAVSVDTYTGDAETRSLMSLPLWCAIAAQIVTVTVTAGTWDEQLVPSGWNDDLYERSSRVNWLVLTRA